MQGYGLLKGGRRRHQRRRSAVLAAVLAVVLVGSVAVACTPTPEPTTGRDLSVTVPDGVGAVIGSTATYPVTVASNGTDATTGPVAVTVVVPPGQTVTAASGTGWDCETTAQKATCRIADANVAAGTSLPAVQVSASVADPTYVAQIYGTVSSVGDVNPANDQAVGEVTVTPPVTGDQLFVQIAGALNLRSGGTITSGDVSITPAASGGLGGADHLVIDATVGTTRVQADLERGFFTLFSGPVSIWDPRLPDGGPVTVQWRGALYGFGSTPWRNLQGMALDLRIPSLDVGGITGALANGITFSLALTAADYSPTPAPPNDPPLSYTGNIPGLNPNWDTPARTVSGAETTLPLQIRPSGAATIGPVTATVDLPEGLDYLGTRSGSTCIELPAVQRRLRCTLNESLTAPLRLNLLSGVAGMVLPVPVPSIDLRVRPTQDGVPYTVSATINSAKLTPVSATTTFSAMPPGPEVGLTMNGPEQTSTLFFTQGNGLSGNQYNFAVDNVGTQTSAANPTVTLNLPAGVTYRGVGNDLVSNPLPSQRWGCSADAQVVTCTRTPGISVTAGLVSALPSRFWVTVDVATGSGPVNATASVDSGATDVNPGGPSKSATATTQVAAAGAPTFDVSLSNGAFTVTNRPVLQGGFNFTVDPSGRLDAISGCGSSMDFRPAVLAVPVVGPTLVPEIYANNKLCVNVTRVPGTNNWSGTVSTDFVTAPVFLPPPIPPEIPLPPVIGPRNVSVSADSNATVGGPVSGSVTGSADGSSVQLVLNGGVNFTTNWRITAPATVDCTDINACP